MNKQELKRFIEVKIEQEKADLQENLNYTYDVIQTGMRLKMYEMALDKLNDTQEEVDFELLDWEEFVNDVEDTAYYLYDNIYDTIGIMDWEASISKLVF